MRRKTVYYFDEKNDDFAGTKIKKKIVDEKFKYIRDDNIFTKFISLFLYYCIAKPIGAIMMIFCFRSSIRNRKAFKKVKHQGYFIYANHTNIIPDAFQPSMVRWFKTNYIIVNSDATSIPGVQNIVMWLGGIPLADTPKAKINFIKCIKTRIDQNHAITIYPEAHIWPYYTRLREFNKDSFRYPVKLNAPCFTITTCYTKHKGLLKFMKHPKLTTYVDGPFYPDQTLERIDAENKLHDEIFNSMNECLKKHSTYEYLKYEKVDDKEKVTKKI